MIGQPAGPTLLGFDVVLVGTVLAGLAAFAVIMAIYAAVTITLLTVGIAACFVPAWRATRVSPVIAMRAE